MNLGVLKETALNETRVCSTPETVLAYDRMKIKVLVESGAGDKSSVTDQAYKKAGALIVSRQELWQKADIVIGVRGIEPAEYACLRQGQILIADFRTSRYPQRIPLLASSGATAIALEKMPRISKAQSMDILSSQNTVAGYKAAIMATNLLDRMIPMMMTAAGHVKPAQALVLGAGVAGLQALATLKRFGAVVYASDVRLAAKEQVESLGGIFLNSDQKEDFEDLNGYADRVSETYLLELREQIRKRLSQTDILITAALSAGREIPLLVTSQMLSLMPSGGVIIDMANGNVEPTNRSDLIRIGNDSLATLLPVTASRFFAQNVLNFIQAFGGIRFKIDLKDDIMSAVCVCHQGAVLER
jgi:NAD(P) transhydrogenase subunit alpha